MNSTQIVKKIQDWKMRIRYLKCPTSCHANCSIISLVMGSRLAFLAPIGAGPPKVNWGATLSNPYPNEPYKKNSASKYSRFNGNSNKSLSPFGTSEPYGLELIFKKKDCRTRTHINGAKKVTAIVFA